MINNSDDDVSLLRAINAPKRGIGTKTIEKLEEAANENNTSIFDSIESGKELAFKNLILDINEKMKDKNKITAKVKKLKYQMSLKNSLEMMI